MSHAVGLNFIIRETGIKLAIFLNIKLRLQGGKNEYQKAIS